MNCITLASDGIRVGSIFLKATMTAVADPVGGGVVHDVVVLPLGVAAKSEGWCGIGDKPDFELLSSAVVSELNRAYAAGHLSAHEMMEGIIEGGEMMARIEEVAAERLDWIVKANDPTSRVRATANAIAGELRECGVGGNRKARRAASSKRRR